MSDMKASFICNSWTRQSCLFFFFAGCETSLAAMLASVIGHARFFFLVWPERDLSSQASSGRVGPWRGPAGGCPADDESVTHWVGLTCSSIFNQTPAIKRSGSPLATHFFLLIPIRSSPLSLYFSLPLSSEHLLCFSFLLPFLALFFAVLVPFNQWWDLC